MPTKREEKEALERLVKVQDKKIAELETIIHKMAHAGTMTKKETVIINELI
jgi:hypothetical protein